MKRLALIIMALIVGSQCYAQERFIIDSAVVTRPSNTTAYSAGDVVRASSGSAFFPIFISDIANRKCWINSVTLSTDTANVTGGSFTLIPYIDTTGVGNSIAADNALFQQNYVFGAKRLQPIVFSLKMYGTTSGGATGALDTQSSINVPFIAPVSKKLFFLLICDGAYTPKVGGKFRIVVNTRCY